MANVANVKVKQGNVLVLSGSSVEISGSGANNAVRVSGDMTVSGTLRADKMEITDVTYVTSSVLYRDGSTKFGNDSSDKHQFSGSVLVSGSVTIASNSGQYNGSGAGLTNISSEALDNNDVTVGSTSISLGGTSTTLAGLTSVTSTGFTGSLNGNADTATSATSADAVANSATFNNGGSGDASGATFDGSSEVTISYNTLGAAGLAATNTFSGQNTFSDFNNQFTGSFSGPGTNLEFLDADNITAGTLVVDRGGTGIDGSSAIKGQLLIGNGSGYTLGEITSSDGTVRITTSSVGEIDLAVSLGAIEAAGANEANTFTEHNTFKSISVTGSGGLTLLGIAPLVASGSVTMKSAVITNVRTVTADASLTDNDNVILAQPTGALKIILTAGTDGRQLVVKKINEDINRLYLSGSGCQIDGQNVFDMYGPLQSVNLVYSGSNWFVL